LNTSPSNHFSLKTIESYQLWKEKKLSAYPMDIDDLIVEVNSPANLMAAEKQQQKVLDKTNMVIYNTHISNLSDNFEENKLQSGQGLLCRNVLHTRESFDELEYSN